MRFGDGSKGLMAAEVRLVDTNLPQSHCSHASLVRAFGCSAPSSGSLCLPAPHRRKLRASGDRHQGRRPPGFPGRGGPQRRRSGARLDVRRSMAPDHGCCSTSARSSPSPCGCRTPTAPRHALYSPGRQHRPDRRRYGAPCRRGRFLRANRFWPCSNSMRARRRARGQAGDRIEHPLFKR